MRNRGHIHARTGDRLAVVLMASGHMSRIRRESIPPVARCVGRECWTRNTSAVAWTTEFSVFFFFFKSFFLKILFFHFRDVAEMAIIHKEV